jgi:hypothetical protein
MSKKPHDDDIAIAREIRRATEFSAFYRNGPHEKYTVRGLPSYEAACAERDRLVAEHSRYGRGGMVYAITPLGSFPCDDALIALSREIA